MIVSVSRADVDEEKKLASGFAPKTAFLNAVGIDFCQLLMEDIVITSVDAVSA